MNLRHPLTAALLLAGLAATRRERRAGRRAEADLGSDQGQSRSRDAWRGLRRISSTSATPIRPKPTASRNWRSCSCNSANIEANEHFDREAQAVPDSAPRHPANLEDAMAGELYEQHQDVYRVRPTRPKPMVT